MMDGVGVGVVVMGRTSFEVVASLIGAGTPLFGTLETAIALERTQASATPAATHLRYRVVR